MLCIGILGVKVYHTELPINLFNMIYTNQNWLIDKLDIDLFRHLISHYNTRLDKVAIHLKIFGKIKNNWYR